MRASNCRTNQTQCSGNGVPTCTANGTFGTAVPAPAVKLARAANAYVQRPRPCSATARASTRTATRTIAEPVARSVQSPARQARACAQPGSRPAWLPLPARLFLTARSVAGGRTFSASSGSAPRFNRRARRRRPAPQQVLNLSKASTRWHGIRQRVRYRDRGGPAVLGGQPERRVGQWNGGQQPFLFSSESGAHADKRGHGRRFQWRRWTVGPSPALSCLALSTVGESRVSARPGIWPSSMGVNPLRRESPCPARPRLLA